MDSGQTEQTEQTEQTAQVTSQEGLGFETVHVDRERAISAFSSNRLKLIGSYLTNTSKLKLCRSPGPWRRCSVATLLEAPPPGPPHVIAYGMRKLQTNHKSY